MFSDLNIIRFVIHAQRSLYFCPIQELNKVNFDHRISALAKVGYMQKIYLQTINMEQNLNKSKRSVVSEWVYKWNTLIIEKLSY